MLDAITETYIGDGTPNREIIITNFFEKILFVLLVSNGMIGIVRNAVGQNNQFGLKITDKGFILLDPSTNTMGESYTYIYFFNH